MPLEDPYQRDVDLVGTLSQVPLILDICARTTGMGFVAVARVTQDRWITCAARDEVNFGLKPGDELSVGTTICREVRDCGQPTVFNDAQSDPMFVDHPTPKLYGFRSYISVPILRGDGSLFGTLCAIDPEPRRVETPETLGMFQLFAELIGLACDKAEEQERDRRALAAERETAALREQFIAVVGHDLRNPVAAVDAGLRRLARDATEPAQSGMIRQMQEATRRMDGIIANLLDFARGRLGKGIPIRPAHIGDAEALLSQVIDEIAVVSDRSILRRIDIPCEILADRARLGQMLSNLLANAAAYGREGTEIEVTARIEAAELVIEVANQGDPIPAQLQLELFRPFTRREASGQPRDGLGLGLYIAFEIARAHGGTLDLTSTIDRTVFIARLPV
ncbi:GAF domain-containing sensor histidine kinase [uncultured Limimaricola sp.]|uniref:GAF domain-containing sensor histidine kinase n=1 Tax=uncultured Limimaricola sp. TaxID=2211667 RepID=UPI0030F8963C